MRLAFEVGRLSPGTGDPRDGRWHFYGVITLGSQSFWLSRWDTVRVDADKDLQIWRGPVMTWYAGRR